MALTLEIPYQSRAAGSNIEVQATINNTDYFGTGATLQLALEDLISNLETQASLTGITLTGAD